MNNDNVFELIIDVVFAMIPQLGGLGPKYQDLVISFHSGERETLPQFHLRALHTRIEIFLFQDKQGKSKTQQVNTSWNCKS